MRMFARLFGAMLLAAAAVPPAAQAVEVNFTTDFGYYGRQSYFYVASTRATTRQEGIDLNFLRGQGSIDAIKKVASGAAMIGFADAGALVLARGNDGIPVKLLAIVYAKPPHAIFALADSGIKTPKDLEGKTLADTAFSAIPLIFNAYAPAAGIDVKKVKWITAEVSSLPSLLATGRVDAIGQFTVGEPLLADAVKPKKLVRLAYKDVGLDYYGNGIVATEQTIKEDPKLLKAFVRATLKGMRDAFADPAEAGVIMHKYHKEISPEVAPGETEMVRELAVVPGQPLGRDRRSPHRAHDRHHAESVSHQTPGRTAGHVRAGLCRMNSASRWLRHIVCGGDIHGEARRTGDRPRACGRHKTFGSGEQIVQALGPLDLAIEAGSFVSIVGPSGCGKSTLLRLIAGLEPPTEGQLRRYGAALDGPSREVGIVFQDHVLFPWASVLENVMLPADVLALPKAAGSGASRLACWN